MENKEEKRAKDYLKSLSVPKPLKIKLKTGMVKPENSKEKQILKELPVENNIHDLITKEEVCFESFDSPFDDDDDFEVPEEEILLEPEPKMDIEEEYAQYFADDFDIKDLEEKEDFSTLNGITEENLVNGWETMHSEVENESRNDVSFNISELPLTQNEEGASVSTDLFLNDIFFGIKYTSVRILKLIIKISEPVGAT